MAEVKIISHDHMRSLEPFHQNLIDELTRLKIGERAIEIEGQQKISTRCRQEALFQWRRRQRKDRLFGAKEEPRMGLERQNAKRGAGSESPAASRFQQRLMATVNTVEVSNGNNGAMQVRRYPIAAAETMHVQ
jgi:hypothetical protein